MVKLELNICIRFFKSYSFNLIMSYIQHYKVNKHWHDLEVLYYTSLLFAIYLLFALH